MASPALNQSAPYKYQPFLVAITALLLALPWLNPFSYGPAPALAKGLVVWWGAVFCWLLSTLCGMDFFARVRAVAAAWVLAAAVSADIGLLQYFGLADTFGPWISNAHAGQAISNLRQRNHFGTLLAIGLAALVWWQISIDRERLRHFLSGKWIGAVAVLLGVAAAASGSRTGLLQLALLALLCLVWRRGWATMAPALLGYALAAFILPLVLPLLVSAPMHVSILERFGQNSGRSVLWLNMLHLVAQKPWLGWGWGELQYVHFMTLYPGTRFSGFYGNLSNAHNLPLHLAVELGAPLATVFCVVMLWLLHRGKPWQEQNATRQLAWSVLAVIGVHSMLEYPLWYGPFQLACVLAIWMLWKTRAAPYAKAADTGLVADRARPSIAAMATAALLTLACIYTAWDYWRISQIYLPASQRAMPYRDDTLNKIRSSWLFANQVKFAELGITPLTPGNARHINALAKEMLHFSPEPTVVQKLLDSDTLLGRKEEFDYFTARFNAAWPFDVDSNTGHKIP